MANGTPGDHPLTDIFVHKREVYGLVVDDLIHKNSDLCSRRELDEWWEREIGWSHDRELALRKARARTMCYSREPKRGVGRHRDNVD